MLSYPSAVALSSRTLNHLADLLRAERARRRGRWWRLDAGQHALLALAQLRNGDTIARLACGFAAHAEDLNAAMRRIGRLAYAILDGTLILIDRVWTKALLLRQAQAPRRERASHRGLRRTPDLGSPALAGAAHDLTAARTHGLTGALTSANVLTFADKAYQGAGGSVHTPFKRRSHRPRLSRRQETVNRHHAKIRAVGERAVATLKGWKVLAKLRCCPRRGHRDPPGHPRPT